MTDTECRIIKAINHIREAIWDLTDGTGFSRNGRMNMKGLEEVMEPLREAFEAHPLSPPSSDDKAPPSSATGDNSGTPEPTVGDEVHLLVLSSGTIVSKNHGGYISVRLTNGTTLDTHIREVMKA